MLRRARFLIALSMAAASAGCAGLDRENYSLIIRKPAHQYRDLTLSEKEELALYDRTRVCDADGFLSRFAYEPFKPFTYCHLHRSCHVPESTAALLLVPVEYPTVLGGYVSLTMVEAVQAVPARFARTLSSSAVWAWEQVFPPRVEPPILPPEKMERPDAR